MKRMCDSCGKEFEAKRETAKFCSGACKLALHRKGVSVTNDTVKKVSVTTEWSSEELSQFGNDLSLVDPLKRITLIPMRSSQEWFESMDYQNLLEEIEFKPLKQLEAENYFIPAWKYHHGKKPNLKGDK